MQGKILYLPFWLHLFWEGSKEEGHLFHILIREHYCISLRLKCKSINKSSSTIQEIATCSILLFWRTHWNYPLANLLEIDTKAGSLCSIHTLWFRNVEYVTSYRLIFDKNMFFSASSGVENLSHLDARRYHSRVFSTIRQQFCHGKCRNSCWLGIKIGWYRSRPKIGWVRE